VPFFRDDALTGFNHNIQGRDLHQPFGMFVGIGQGALKPLTVSGELPLSIQKMERHLSHF
jgi:hypothetical protein